MAAVAEHAQRQLDRMADVAHRGHPSRPQPRALHDAGVELDRAFAVEAGADACVEDRLVLHLADGRDHRSESAGADLRPTNGERSLDRGLTLRPLAAGRIAGAAVDDEGAGAHTA